MADEQQVSYTVKELLTNLSEELGKRLDEIVATQAVIIARLEKKAETSVVEDLIRRVTELELQRAGSVAISGTLKWVFGGTFAALVGSIVYLAASAIGHG